MRKFTYISETVFTVACPTNAQTTLQPKIVDQNDFTAEFHHLKVKKPSFHDTFNVFNPPKARRGRVGELILVSLESTDQFS